jgi:hypothetical protein
VPVGNILKNGYSASRPPSGREVPRGSLREFFIYEEVPAGPCGGIPPNQRAGCCPEGHPALWSGGRPPGYISPNLPQKFHFIQEKLGKKEREKRKRRSPVHTSISRYILIQAV